MTINSRAANPTVSFVERVLNDHLYFLKRNTGVTNDPTIDLFILNPDGVLSNNRHFIQHTAMEGHPNNDATTEGQSLLVLGFIYAYHATKDKKYLSEAERFWQAYVDKFYMGVPAPDTGEWHCNWIINGKEPFLASWPLDPVYPTHAGFKGVETLFVEGQAVIQPGPPHYAEYMEIATFAFDGELDWNAINASIHAVGDWNSPGVKYEIDYIVDYLHRKVDSTGKVLATNHLSQPSGTIVLKDKTVTGMHKVNFANAQPVEHGGYLIKRNEAYHNRPLRVPITKGFQGNASDAEVWFYDACWHLWKITGNAKYKKALDAVERTITSYIDIDRDTRFFRKTTVATTPFTDGIAYDYSYPSGIKGTYGRDAEGNITIDIPTEAQFTMEQNAIHYKLKVTSRLYVSAHGKNKTTKAPIRIDAFLGLTKDLATDAVEYRIALNPALTFEDQMFNVNKAVGALDPTKHTVMAEARNVYTAGGDNVAFVQEINFGPQLRVDYVCEMTFNVEWAKCFINFWTIDDKKHPAYSITYKSEQPVRLTVTDSSLSDWGITLPASADWTTKTWTDAEWTLNAEQSNPDRPNKPTSPVELVFENVRLIVENFTTPFKMRWYCLNEQPAIIGNVANYYTKHFGIRFLTGAGGADVVLGDCRIANYNDAVLGYTPGIIPYSNITSPYSPVYDGWRGLPYPGYQYPFTYIYSDNARAQLFIDNQFRFLRDSQIAYKTQYNVEGPGAASYVWNRWDCLKYGTADTWNFHHWWDDAWAGYQPRAFYAAARAIYELKKLGRAIPQNASDYVTKWITYLIDFFNKNGATPTEFPIAGPGMLPEPDDYTAHMSGLWLAGFSMAWLADVRVPGMAKFMNDNAKILAEKSVREPSNHIMNGSFSSWPGGGQYYGFYTGEVMRGLSLYLLAMRGDKNH